MDTAGPSMVDNLEHLPILSDVLCQECGYNLRGLTRNRCPECGGNIASVRLEVSQIPWARRKEIGWLRAYWRTVWWTSIHYKRFCEEIIRQVTYRDSQLFRGITIGFAYLPLFVFTILLYVRPGARPRWLTDLNPILDMVWPVVLFQLLVIGLLFMMTGVASYFFEARDLPAKQRNNAIAMSYYCCGSLAWMLLPALLAWVAPLTRPISQFGPPLLSLIALFWGLTLFVVWWLDLIHTVRRVLPHRPRRAVAVVFLLPAVWFACVVIAAGIIPFIAAYIYLLIWGALTT